MTESQLVVLPLSNDVKMTYVVSLSEEIKHLVFSFQQIYYGNCLYLLYLFGCIIYCLINRTMKIFYFSCGYFMFFFFCCLSLTKYSVLCVCVCVIVHVYSHTVSFLFLQFYVWTFVFFCPLTFMLKSIQEKLLLWLRTS